VAVLTVFASASCYTCPRKSVHRESLKVAGNICSCRGFPDQQKLSIAILAAKDNKFEPSPPPALIDAITDELLVVASDTVAAAATEAQTKPSGKAKYRLLAWLVADARGAVRAATADAVELAESARAAARSAAASDVTLQATLQATLAGIDADQQAAVGRPRSEVYVGFHELDALLPGTDGYQPLPPDLPKCGQVGYELTKGREDGISFPFACTQNRARAGSMKSAPIPRDLVELLGPDAAAQLWDEYGGTGYEAPQWWSLGVPNLIKLLRHELAEKEMWLAEDELLLKERVPREWVETARKEAAEAAEATAEAEEEIQELKKQLQEAKGREDALNGVIDRCRWGESAERGGKRPRSCE